MKSQERNNIQDVVTASYHSFIFDEKKYFQIDSYGKSNRKNPDKVSQTNTIRQRVCRKDCNITKNKSSKFNLLNLFIKFLLALLYTLCITERI